MKIILKLFKHVSKGRRRQLLFLIALMIISSIFEVISIGTIFPFMGVLISPVSVFEKLQYYQLTKIINVNSPKELMLPITIIFTIVILISSITRIILLWLQIRLGSLIGADLGLSIYSNILKQPYSRHISRNSSEIIAAISTKSNSIVSGVVQPSLIILSYSTILLTIFLALLVINPLAVSLVFVSMGSIYLVIVLLARERLIRNSKVIGIKTNQLMRVLQEGLGGIREIILDGTQATFQEIYRDVDIRLRRAQANVQIIAWIPRLLVEAVGMIIISFLCYFLTNDDGGIGSALPFLAAMALGAQRIMPLLQQLYQSWSSIKAHMKLLEDIVDLLFHPLPSSALSKTSYPIKYEKSISLTNVSFRYTSQSLLILENINLEILKGDKVGLVGDTGSGKSTLVDIIMGLLDPVSGTLSIDGVSIRSDNCRSWQAHIAHVPQSIFLIDASIAQNIAFGIDAKNIDYRKVERSAKMAQISSTIEGWPEKYHTLVGERGVRLSGGQRQRIGIARAFYRDADVIIFDEATSALDNATEVAVMNAIQSMGNDITVIIIAHRLSTLKNCNKILEVKNRQLNLVGRYDNLIQDK